MAAGKEFFEWVWPTIQQLFQQRRASSKTVEFRATYHHDPAPHYSARLEVVKPPWHKRLKDSAFAKGMITEAGKAFFKWVLPTIQQLFQQSKTSARPTFT